MILTQEQNNNDVKRIAVLMPFRAFDDSDRLKIEWSKRRSCFCLNALSGI
jgi:hypothetical protein